MTLLVVMGTGALGAVARLLVEHAVSSRAGRTYPWGTLLVNLTGSFALGLVLGSTLHGQPRTAIAVGFLGAYTTFSAYAVEGVLLAERGRTRASLSYLVGTVVATTAAAWTGLLCGG